MEVDRSRGGTKGTFWARMKRRKFLSAEEISLVGRVLTYAHSYRRQIGGALLVGILAGGLTALNMLALIPVLGIILNEPGEEKIANIERNIADAREELAEAGGLFKSIQPFYNVKRHEFRKAYTEWVIREKDGAIYKLAILLIVSQILRCMLEFASKYQLQKSFYLATLKMRNDLYNSCLRLDLPDFHRITSGDLISRLNNDMRAVRLVFTNVVGDVLLQPFSVVALLLAMFYLNWQMTLIVMAGLPVVVLPITLIGKKLRNMGKRDEEEDARILGYTQETIQGLMIVKAFTGEKSEATKFRALSRDIARRQIRREKYRLYSEPFVEISASMAMAAVLCVGAYLILESNRASMSAPEFLIYIGLLTRFYPPIKKISSAFIKMQKSLASAERIFEVIDQQPSIVEKPDAIVLKEFRDRIDFRNVSFAYGPDKPLVLEGFSLTLPKGRKIALVGRTGAGKSTVARLLPRFWDFRDGEILVDGVDIRDVTLHSLRSQIALVSQETILFNDTIMNNIRYARPGANEQEVVAAARAAYADEFIDKLANGYQTVIGERGNELSGGQRQRLAIARALLANTPILILDEATSALDNESERIVQAAIERLMENRTVLVIAHRLSTVRKADEIIVMEAGRIKERGTHLELMELRGRYFDMVTGDELANIDSDDPDPAMTR